ncbi:DNA-directed RNA polymerase subunit B [Candidatus Woesearchaeota archaeon]|nr:DNA-directed RNA polymerase subunit B [Candidatus Woesearchaeota archaeon]
MMATDVFVDGRFVGTVKDPEAFAKRFVDERRLGNIPISVNVLNDEPRERIVVETAKGRSLRPVLVVKEGKLLLTDKHVEQLRKNEIAWTDLIKQGIIEYLDAMEEEAAYIAIQKEDLTPEHTHLEVSPLDLVGLCTSMVPFGNYNHGVRMNQGSKNQKQALGLYVANYAVRMDMDVSVLHYPQFPIVTSATHYIADYDKHPSGQNVIVAVMSYQGYNMEDAIVINQGAIQRGLARSSYFRPVVSEELRYSGGLIDEICIPDKDVKGYRAEHDYRFLEEDGIIYPEAVIAEGDVLIGKTSPPRFLSSTDEYNLASNQRRESSMSLKHGEKGIVDFVFLTENAEGNKLVQTRLREQRIPEIGDKFTSRHGQKGVISYVAPEVDVPFSASGMKPDIIFGTHGIPSRMTVSHLFELLAGKTGALAGRYVDATMFDAEHEVDIREELRQVGFQDNGTETLYNGITGERYHVQIFIGNMYYLKLKHMVANKIHSRARGPIQLLTRQPTEGRAKEGGLRLGEMEKDTFVAHGASLLLKERFDSDKTVVPIGEKSGLISYYDAKKGGKATSTLLPDEEEMHNVEISYAFKLMLDEFMSLGVYPKLVVNRKF